MMVVMAVVSSILDRSMQDLCGRALREILKGNVAVFRGYVSELQRDSQRLVEQEETRLMIEAMIAGEEPSEPILVSWKPDTWKPRQSGVVAWVVTDATGKIVASDDPERIDKVCGWSDSDRRELESGNSVLVLPRSIAKHDDCVLVSLSPWVDGFQLKGTLGWVIDARRDLSDRFAITQTDSTFIFDPRGQLLSRSRFLDQLIDEPGEDQTYRHAGVRSERAWRPTVLRDPGFPMLETVELSDTQMAERPLTKMAEQALRGSSGLDIHGYRDCRGVLVCGAWQWLPEYQLGMAMEVDKSAAFKAVHVIQLLIAIMAVVLVGLAFVIAALAIRAKQLHQRLLDREGDVRRLGQYELTELLGVGGMGSVYRGRHQFLRRDVAIKVLEGEQLSKQAITRFRREVQLTSNLRHPNTIAIYDYGQVEDVSRSGQAINASTSQIAKALKDPNATDKADSEPSDSGGVFYYVMEYIDGITLQQLIDFYGPQSPERTVHFLLQICGSIAEAHQAGLIHRDIKPGNVLLCAQSNSHDLIKVLDFGLVKDINASDTMAMTMTRSDSMTGTPLYMAPETIRDAKLASTSGDLYSIGAVGYALLTGKPTYEGDSAIDLCLKQLEKPPVDPDVRLGRPLPRSLQNCLMSCLSLDSNDRPASVAELTKRLTSISLSTQWRQEDAALWWEHVFEANRKQTPAETKSDTVADETLA